MVVVLIHTSECAFNAAVNVPFNDAGKECPGAIRTLISIASSSEELSLSGLSV
jgi:hypothetical protein